MARPAARRDEDRVGAQDLARGPAVARHPGARGAGEPLALVDADGAERIVDEAARLYLDKGDGVAALDDEVDLAARRRIASRQQAVALEHEKCERHVLGEAAAQIRGAPPLKRRPHGRSFARASARA